MKRNYENNKIIRNIWNPLEFIEFMVSEAIYWSEHRLTITLYVQPNVKGKWAGKKVQLSIQSTAMVVQATQWNRTIGTEIKPMYNSQCIYLLAINFFVMIYYSYISTFSVSLYVGRFVFCKNINSNQKNRPFTIGPLSQLFREYFCFFLSLSLVFQHKPNLFFMFYLCNSICYTIAPSTFNQKDTQFWPIWWYSFLWFIELSLTLK